MEKMTSYSGLLILTTAKEDAADEIKKSITSVITDNSGKVSEIKMMGRHKLSYPVKKHPEGVYVEVLFTSPSEKVAKIMRQFQINTDILRAIIDKK